MLKLFTFFLIAFYLKRNISFDNLFTNNANVFNYTIYLKSCSKQDIFLDFHFISTLNKTNVTLTSIKHFKKNEFQVNKHLDSTLCQNIKKYFSLSLFIIFLIKKI